MPNGTVHVALQQPSVLDPISDVMSRYPITPPILNASRSTLTRGYYSYSIFRKRPLKNLNNFKDNNAVPGTRVPGTVMHTR